MRLDTEISKFNGVGKARADKLRKIGIECARDLIYFFPRTYEYRGDVSTLGSYSLDAPRSYILTVATEVTNAKLKGRLTMSKFRAFDETGSVEVIFFNSPYVKDIFHVGTVFRFYGKPVFSKSRRLNLVNPQYEPVIENVALDDFIPKYSLTEGLTNKLLQKLIKTAIDGCIGSIEETLPDVIRTKNNLCTLSFALKNIHFPESHEALKIAQKRLAFDEIMLFALGISISVQSRAKSRGATFSPCSIKPLTDILPYELTTSQKEAINDIYRDTVLKRTDGFTPAMSRILVGDVGCGKTVCAIAAMYIAYSSGYQSALLVPTEILATQHYEEMQRLLEGLGMKIALLTGSTPANEKRKIYEQLESGEINAVVGTHALISERVNFAKLGLIITDEQHRFGVAQRAVLKNRSHDAHMLVMSATPIPRTLALALYGDLDISRITDMPKGRMRVDTYVVDEGYRERLNTFIEKQVAAGGQCYIVCPSIEADELTDHDILTDSASNGTLVSAASLNLKDAVSYTEELRKRMPKLIVECLHGRMRADVKDDIMHRFAAGEIHVLVSTTVIEVGVNVPNASLMVVENAERFGLSQLHQLRGRVGRGSRKSYCVLVSDNNSEKARARLEVMRTIYDGFEIADKDLLLRGPGDFFSYDSNNIFRQSGGFKFDLASLCDDKELFDAAFSSAKTIIEIDPALNLPEHRALAYALKFSIAPQSSIS